MNDSAPIDDTDEYDAEIMRTIARYKVERLTVAAGDLRSQMMSASKWLSAALLTLNGGGMLATIGAIERLDTPLHAAICFCLGIVFVMLNGVLIQHATELNIPRVSELTYYWLGVSHTGYQDEEAEKGYVDAISKVDRWGIIAPLMGWISGCLFLAGVLMLATGIETSDRDNDRRCAAIQKDMLSARPLRTDDVSIFTALGCRAHGAGSVYARPRTSR